MTIATVASSLNWTWEYVCSHASALDPLPALNVGLSDVVVRLAPHHAVEDVGRVDVLGRQ
ncbi:MULTISPECIES: hypothetical protein [unclassified Frondihabitans]|uniref:hypothetical protein n=1 Tax=unclassified Frondihabitans TaxID=2626248 RepID=UPI000F50D282|nr:MULTISPECIES: hypothetical protein [unclassified Frondihabitans]RPE77889.1 hypothetical protein EDF37_0557 [Frondihabitans sp. PhB153]RPF08169.1 hypothetical protein EDF39_0558 [Frondihabitans sp. PhB161]